MEWTAKTEEKVEVWIQKGEMYLAESEYASPKTFDELTKIIRHGKETD